LIKNYYENKGILKSLSDAGIIKPTGKIFPIGFDVAKEAIYIGE